jgi:hypothetical protein
MPLHHEYSVADGILHLSVSGKGDKRDLLKLSVAILKTIRKSSVPLVLIDLRDAVGRLGIVDTYMHVSRYPAGLRSLRIAILDKVENREYYAFHENVASNRGFNLRYFNDVPAAEAWLRTQPS